MFVTQGPPNTVKYEGQQQNDRGLMLVGGVVCVVGRPPGIGFGALLIFIAFVLFAFQRLFVKMASHEVPAEVLENFFTPPWENNPLADL